MGTTWKNGSHRKKGSHLQIRVIRVTEIRFKNVGYNSIKWVTLGKMGQT